MASLLFINNNRFVKVFKNTVFLKIENINDGKKEYTKILFFNENGKILDTLKKPYISPITGVFNVKITDDSFSDTVSHIKVDIDDSFEFMNLIYNVEHGLEYISKTSKIKCRKLIPSEVDFLENKKTDKITLLI